MELAALGDQLRGAGLTPRALAAWAGTDRAAALPGRLPALACADPVPAAAALALLVAGAELPIDRARRLPIDALIEHALVERDARRIFALRAIVPVGRSLVVCDRADAPAAADLVCWPDDSSHHLATAIPAGRRARWVDLGAGSAFAQLARPELADQQVALDLNPRAVQCARIGARLSGLARLEAIEADLGAAPREPADLVTCNAPIPELAEGAASAPRTAPMWRRAGDGLFERLFAVIPALLSRDERALAVVHAARDAIPDELPGERAIVSYTPPGVRGFAVLWWRPHAPPRLATGARALTVARPHLEPRDRDDVLC